MFVDYYDILGISDEASLEEIKSIYKRLCLVYHPDKTTDSKSNEKFKLIKNAYDTLSDDNKRENYDKNYQYFVKNNSEQLNKREEELAKQISPPIFYDVELSLEQLMTGCLMEIKVPKLVPFTDGKFTKVEKVFDVTVVPGWKTGTKITYNGQGNEQPGKLPGDVVFIVKEKPHEKFTREGDDLKCSVSLTEWQIKKGTHIQIPLLSGRTIPFVVNPNSISDGTIQKFPGRGLPSSKDPQKFGDLYVSFDIVTNRSKDIIESFFHRLMNKIGILFFALFIALSLFCILFTMKIFFKTNVQDFFKMLIEE